MTEVDPIGTTGPPPPPPLPEGDTSFFEVYLIVGKEIISTRAVTDEVAELLSRNGIDPNAFEVLSWPTGASRHSRIRLLLASVDYVCLQTALNNDWTQTVDLKMSDKLFPQMYVLEQATVAWTEGTGPVYAIDVVDARWWWSKSDANDTDNSQNGFNLTTDDKAVLYRSTTPSPDYNEPFTYFECLDELHTSLQFTTAVRPWSIPDGSENGEEIMSQDLGLRDVQFGSYNITEVIDRVCGLCGLVMVAIPFDSTYEFRFIRNGGSDLNDIMEANGGMGPADSRVRNYILEIGPAAMDGVTITDDLVRDLLDSPAWIARHRVRDIDVAFPAAIEKGEGYTFTPDDGIAGGGGFDLGTSWVLGRWAKYSWNPPPDYGPTSEEEITLFDNHWAIRNTSGQSWVNDSDSATRTNQVIDNYIARYSSGAGRFRFVGMHPLFYGGATMTKWSVVRHGPDKGVFTTVRGLIDDPIFGHDYNKPLTAQDLSSIGPVRAMPRSDGSVLLDATGRAPTTLFHLARITGVNPKDEDGQPAKIGFNATYKAISIDTYDTVAAPDPADDTRITVPKDPVLYDNDDTKNSAAWVDPITRPVGLPDKVPLSSTSGPAQLGDLCFIVIDTIPGQDKLPDIRLHALMAWEEIASEPCPSEASSAIVPDPIGEAMTLAAMGIL